MNTEENVAWGLSPEEVERSRKKHGDNVLTPPRKTPLWKLYLEKYNDPIIRILLVAIAISLVMAVVEQEFMETIGIALAVLFATTVGFYFERDAAKKFNVLTQMNEEQPVKVRRQGRVMTIGRRDVVVGDVVLLEIGDEVPADGELIEAVCLEMDESSLTGEPMATKRKRQAQDEAGAADGSTYPHWMVMRSSMVMNGHGEMKVTAVGDKTEIGHVARSSAEETHTKTPLNEQLERLAKLISKVGTAVSIAAFVLFLGHDVLTNPLWHTTRYVEMTEVVLRYFMMAVTLIVMAVPEGLPMAVTLSLALNMRRMLKSNNLVRKLHACETMGAVNVICTDKTGTLTQNQMKVVEMFALEDGNADARQRLAQAIAVNSTAELNGEQAIGNPTEAALLRWTRDQGYDYEALRHAAQMLHQTPFTTEKKYMETTVLTASGPMTFMKGAPEVVLSRCDGEGIELGCVKEKLLHYQQQAMRTLAFAYTEGDQQSSPWHLQAIVGISDPVRQDVPEAVAQCRKAGIEVKIVTGDTSATAIEIARQIGIWDEQADAKTSAPWHITGQDFAALSDQEALQRAAELRVMSRARPADKQRLVQLLQRNGEIVAVTGDGTNDAPALHHAHVGLSLGSGTSVAKAASDITLLDDSFRSIVNAVMWGRSLYRNIQRFLFFQLIVNVTALLLVLGGSLIGTELPLTVTQILWVNLIMDTFAAMALASLPPSREVMNHKPRPRHAFIINRSMGWGIATIGLLFFLVLFALLWLIETMGSIEGITVMELTEFFTFFVMLQWWNLFNAKMLGSNHSAFRLIHRCKGMLLVLGLILLGQWLIVQFGGRMFRTTPLPWQSWAWIMAASSPVLWIGEAYRMVCRIMKRK